MTDTTGIPLEALARTRRRAEERAARAYAALLEAALREAAEEGANVRDVARRAGIAHGTIYNELERRRRARETDHHTTTVEGAARSARLQP